MASKNKICSNCGSEMIIRVVGEVFSLEEQTGHVNVDAELYNKLLNKFHKERAQTESNRSKVHWCCTSCVVMERYFPEFRYEKRANA